MKHPFYDYTTEDAIQLAKNLIYLGEPGVRQEDMPDPTYQEALETIQEAAKHQGFNWITGAIAAQILRIALGEDPEKVIRKGC